MKQAKVAEQNGELIRAYRLYRAAGEAEDTQNALTGAYCGQYDEGLWVVLTKLVKAGRGDEVSALLDGEDFSPARHSIICALVLHGEEKHRKRLAEIPLTWEDRRELERVMAARQADAQPKDKQR